MPFTCKHSSFFLASQKNWAGFLGRILPSPYSPTMPRAKLRQSIKTAIKHLRHLHRESLKKPKESVVRPWRQKRHAPHKPQGRNLVKKRKVVMPMVKSRWGGNPRSQAPPGNECEKKPRLQSCGRGFVSFSAI
jgi:hypothetical protein